jgi:hypothetical protein
MHPFIPELCHIFHEWFQEYINIDASPSVAILSHHACWDVMGAENITELSPRHLIVRRASGGVVDPPRAGVTTQLLCGEESLLHLCAT